MLCEIRNLAYIYTGHTVYSSRSNGALITSRWDAYSYSFPASLIHFSPTPYIGVNDCTTEAHRKLVLGIMMVPFSERQNACCALVVFHGEKVLAISRGDETDRRRCQHVPSVVWGKNTTSDQLPSHRWHKRKEKRPETCSTRPYFSLGKKQSLRKWVLWGQVCSLDIGDTKTLRSGRSGMQKGLIFLLPFSGLLFSPRRPNPLPKV